MGVGAVRVEVNRFAQQLHRLIEIAGLSQVEAGAGVGGAVGCAWSPPGKRWPPRRSDADLPVRSRAADKRSARPATARPRRGLGPATSDRRVGPPFPYQTLWQPRRRHGYGPGPRVAPWRFFAPTGWCGRRSRTSRRRRHRRDAQRSSPSRGRRGLSGARRHSSSNSRSASCTSSRSSRASANCRCARIGTPASRCLPPTMPVSRME